MRTIHHILFALSVICLAVPTAMAQSQPDPNFHLYLLIGQSNMSGRGPLPPGEPVLNKHILTLDKEGHWVPAKDPLHFDKPGESAVGPGLSFAQAIWQADTSITIGLIPCAVGGTTIAKWLPGAYDKNTKTHPYDDAVERAKVAMQAGVLKGILWHQGEGDSFRERYKTYQQSFEDLLDNLAQSLKTDVQQIPVLIGEIGRYYVKKAPESAMLNQVFAHLAEIHPNIRVVSSEGLTDRGDGTHFDTRSAVELGKRYAETLLKVAQ